VWQVGVVDFDDDDDDDDGWEGEWDGGVSGG
jgi:hypothetical protein